MKKIYTLLAAAAVVATASAAAPQLNRSAFSTDFKISPAALKADASLLPAPVTVSRAAETVEGPLPVYEVETHALYYSTVDGWFSEDSQTGALVGTSKVVESGNPTGNTYSWTIFTIEGTKATIENFGAKGVTLEAEFVPASGQYPSYFVAKSGQLCDILDKDGNPTGEKWGIYAHNIKTNEVLEEFPLFIYSPDRYVFWQSEIEGDQLSSLDQLQERLVLANGADPSAEGYKEYFRAYDVIFDAVNSVMQFDVQFPGSTDTFEAGMYTWSQYAVTEDNGERSTWIDVFNLFSVFNTMTFAEANFLVDFDNHTASAEDVALANANQPAYTYWLWGMGNDGKAEDTVFTTDLVNDETSTGKLLTYMIADGAWIGTLSQPEQAKCTNIMFQLAFALDLDDAGVANVAVADENAPVEFFNLQGVRVANPENGLFIRRQGNTATKVLVK